MITLKEVSRTCELDRNQSLTSSIAAFVEHLSSEWSSKTPAQQQYLSEGLDEYDSGFQEFAGLVETALSLRLSAIGQRNRRRTLEALNTCRDTLLSLVDVHRHNADILEDFR